MKTFDQENRPGWIRPCNWRDRVREVARVDDKGSRPLGLADETQRRERPAQRAGVMEKETRESVDGNFLPLSASLRISPGSIVRSPCGSLLGGMKIEPVIRIVV